MVWWEETSGTGSGGLSHDSHNGRRQQTPATFSECIHTHNHIHRHVHVCTCTHTQYTQTK